MEIAALLLFLLFLLTGAAGIILPVLPGVPLVAVGAVLAAWMTGFAGLGWAPLLWVIALAVLSQVLEYVAGLIGARYYGARRAGLWDSILGSIVGVIWLPPLGLLIGALGGAIVGELLTGRPLTEAVRAGFGALLGALGGVLAKGIILIAIALIVIPRLL